MRVTMSGQIGGKQFGGEIVRDDANEDATQTTLAAGKAGTLSTRTDNNTGTLTLGSGHGITTGATIDLYWEGGIRRGMTVGTVSGTSVPIDLGAGDNLPAQDTAIVACVQTLIDVDFDGDTITGVIVATRDARASVEIQDEADAAIADASFDLDAGEPKLVAFDVNIFAGLTIGRVAVSNGSSSTSTQVTVGFVRDNLS